ncbi:MAG: signal recognition particle protein [Fastidiosipilaceae bacterium]|jgi:signal recognition particle subunit SRP54
MFESLSGRLQAITAKFRGKSRVTDADIKAMMKEIRMALLEADVNYKVVKELVNEIGEKSKGVEVMQSLTPGQQVVKIVNESLTDILGSENQKLTVDPSGFTVVMLYGLQGSGKTTTAAKLGLLLRKKGKKVMMTSVDVHRPAAAKQLEVLGKSINVPVFIQPEEKDAAKIAKAAVEHARYMLCDTLIVDTAGRMTIDEELMSELKEVASIVNPTEKLLIVDAMIGQEAVNIALEFDRQIGLDGYIMTKLDGDARGGAALSIKHMTGKPIKFIGVGEKVDALEEYHPDRMASRILGMGDVLSLIDKVSANLDQEAADRMVENLRQNRFTMNDMLEQFRQIQNMGSIKDLLGMIPGIKGKQLDSVNVDDKQIDRMTAIIQSMTEKERENASILNASRRKRIAKGSGTTVQDVNKLVRQYEDMSKMIKQFSGTKGKKKRFGAGMMPNLRDFKF